MKKLLILGSLLAALQSWAADSGAGALVSPVYGELYVHDGVTAMTLTNAGTAYTAAPAMTSGNSQNITVVTSTNTFTITKAGLYMYAASFSFSGTANKTIEVSAWTNNVEAINTNFQRKISSGGDVGSAAKVAFLNLKVGDYVQVRVTGESNSDTITIQQANFSLRLLQ
jgi:prophage DNA circulation protein